MKQVCWKSIGEKIGKLDARRKSQFFQGLSCSYLKSQDPYSEIESIADKVAKMKPSDRAMFFNRFAESTYNFCAGDLEIEYLLTGMKIHRKYKQTLKRALTCLWIREGLQ